MGSVEAQGALFKAASSYLQTAGVPADSVSWPNIGFDPAGKSIWAAVHHNPNSPVAVSIGDQGIDRETGFLQIDLNIPVGGGDGVLRQWYNLARLFFPAGLVVSSSGQNVIVNSCGVSQGMVVDNWFRKSLTIAYRADFVRASANNAPIQFLSPLITDFVENSFLQT